MLLPVYSMFLHKKSYRFFFNTIKICTQAAQQKILIQTSRQLARSILQNIAQYILYIMQHSGAAKFFKILKSGAGLPNSAVWFLPSWPALPHTPLGGPIRHLHFFVLQVYNCSVVRPGKWSS